MRLRRNQHPDPDLIIWSQCQETKINIVTDWANKGEIAFNWCQEVGCVSSTAHPVIQTHCQVIFPDMTI